jgi:hypothetical protein
MKMLLPFVTALVLLAACAPRLGTSAVTETEKALCDAWQGSLPTRSRNDTPETRDAIGLAYDEFEAACQREAFPR